MDQYSKCGLYSEERAILRQWKRCKRNLPVLARSPMTAHWGIPDPAAVDGAEDKIATAFRELLMNAIEHGGQLDPEKMVDLSYIRTARCIVYYIRDPGEGFSFQNLAHAAVANTPDDPFRHVELREQAGTRPGGFGLLLTQSFADELIYSGKGNEVILIKYL